MIATAAADVATNGTLIIVAVVAAIPGVVGAWVTLRTHRQVRTNNGLKNGEYVERIDGAVSAMARSLSQTATTLATHTVEDALTAASLSDALDKQTRLQQEARAEQTRFRAEIRKTLEERLPKIA